MTVFGTGDRADGNRTVERYEAPAFVCGKRQQVRIGDLPGSENAIPVEMPWRHKAEIVGPERMKRPVCRFGKPLGHQPLQEGGWDSEVGT